MLGFLGSELAAQVRLRAGRRLDSAALVADGHHARVDGLVSLGVVADALAVAAPRVYMVANLRALRRSGRSAGWVDESATGSANFLVPVEPERRHALHPHPGDSKFRRTDGLPWLDRMSRRHGTCERGRFPGGCGHAAAASGLLGEQLIEELADGRRRVGAGKEPVTGSPSRKTATVGMLWIPKRAASACSASMSILTSSSFPIRFSTSLSIAGPSVRRGP